MGVWGFRFRGFRGGLESSWVKGLGAFGFKASMGVRC